MATFSLQKISDIALFNPRETLRKNQECKKVSMECLSPFTKKITGFEQTVFSGGTKFRNGDTVVARITPCLENGKTAKISGLADGEIACGSTEFIVLRASPGKSDPDFIYYLATSPSFREVAIKSMVGSSGRQRVQQDVLENLELTLPDYSAQVRIGQILSAFDDKIELNAQINHNLEEQIEAVFEDLFINSPQIDHWEQGTIANLGKVIGGSTPSKAKPEYYTFDGIAWITPKDLSAQKTKYISKGEQDITPLGLKNSSAVIMPRGTVLFSSRAPIGYIAIAKSEVTTNQGFKSVVPYSHIGTAFVYCFLKHNLSKIESMASGSTFKEVSGSVMKAIPAIIPDSKTLAQFSTLTQPLFEQQELLEAENQKLTQLRDTLLPKLMSGEIDVSEVEV